jgi:hypothetical protein
MATMISDPASCSASASRAVDGVGESLHLHDLAETSGRIVEQADDWRLQLLLLLSREPFSRNAVVYRNLFGGSRDKQPFAGRDE